MKDIAKDDSRRRKGFFSSVNSREWKGKKRSISSGKTSYASRCVMDRRRAFPASSGGFFSIGRLMDTWIFFLFVAIAGECFLFFFLAYVCRCLLFRWEFSSRMRPPFFSLSLSCYTLSNCNRKLGRT